MCLFFKTAFVGLDETTLTLSPEAHRDLSGSAGELAGFQRFNALKEANPELVTLLAVGGWEEGIDKTMLNMVN